jgi:hypothetical protein
MVSAPFWHRSTLTGTKDTGSDTLFAPAGQPVQAGSPGTTRPPLVVGTGVADADAAVADTAGKTDAFAAGAALCVLAHPAASAPAASSGTARAAARPTGLPSGRNRLARETRESDEVDVLIAVPRFSATPLRRPPAARGFTRAQVLPRSRQETGRLP